MDKLMNELAEREIFYANFNFFFLALGAGVTWWYVTEFHADTLFWGISSAIYVLCIAIILYSRRRNPLDAESIEGSCLYWGVIFGLWNLQILYFYNSYSLIVIFILGVVLPVIVLFQFNKHYEDVQVNFLALIGYYLLMLFCLNIVFYISALLYVFGALILWCYLINRKEILNGGDEESIKRYFCGGSIFDHGGFFVLVCVLAFSPFMTNERFVHPVPLLLVVMSIMFINEYLLLIMEQRAGGSHLADVFS
ncbi:MAG: hypothetical protein FWD87_11250 [Spirochaetaceae bacterium]|nr:hypothetical protein [Spirochaetaceae bacterium]